MKSYTIREFASFIEQSDFPVFVCGAGISFGVAPLARDMKLGLLDATVSVASIGQSLIDPKTTESAYEELDDGYLTLELLASMISYRVPEMAVALREAYEDMLIFDTHIGSANEAIARALCSGKLSAVLTSNFDNGLVEAIIRERSATSVRVITNASASGKSVDAGDICAFHGTVAQDFYGQEQSGISTFTARELAHPFLPPMHQYLRSVIERSDALIFVGSSVSDHYDMNVMLAEYVSETQDRDEQSQRKSKFYCLPHEGNTQNISEFAHKFFNRDNIIDLDSKENPYWLVELCDLLSNKNTNRSFTRTADRKYVQAAVLSAFEKHRGDLKKVPTNTANRASDVIRDIAVGLSAFWSASEHYRLESLGLHQEQIATFGRPRDGRKFYGIPVAILIQLQKEYWEFNSLMRDKTEISRDANQTFEKGRQLYQSLYNVKHDALFAANQCSRGIDQAGSFVAAAIAANYMGLIGLRFKEKRGHSSLSEEFLVSYGDSDRNFLNARDTAKFAEPILEEYALSLCDGGEDAKAYSDGLNMIVNWKDWMIAPWENWARSDIAQTPEKLDELLVCIRHRIDRICEAQKKSTMNPDAMEFSVAGNAAQCSLRIMECVRALCGVGELGSPTFSNPLQRSDIDKDLGELKTAAEICIDAARRTSALKNRRFMGAYDALTIIALSRGEAASARRYASAARSYSNNGDLFGNWFKQVLSRFDKNTSP